MKGVLNCNLKNSMFISILNIVYLVIMLYLVINNLYSNNLSKSIGITIILLLTYVIGIVSLFKVMIGGASFSYSILKESENFLQDISEYEVSDKGVKVNANSTIQIKNVTFKYKKGYSIGSN